jgi:hypothetical protein
VRAEGEVVDGGLLELSSSSCRELTSDRAGIGGDSSGLSSVIAFGTCRGISSRPSTERVENVVGAG